MFQFPRFPPTRLWVRRGVQGHDPLRVAAFGHPRLYAR